MLELFRRDIQQQQKQQIHRLIHVTQIMTIKIMWTRLSDAVYTEKIIIYW